jgi:hypothetical protein
LKKTEDYYFNERGLMVFKKEYHLKRGYCCKSGCKHCPYGYKTEFEQKLENEKPGSNK